MALRVPLGDDAVDVSVVSWNSWPDLRKNLPAMVAQDYPAYRIVVVDNGSTDATADEVEANFPDVTVIRRADNGGYAGGNNIGFAQSQSKYIAVLNPDARPERGWLRALVRALESNPNAALATSKVLLASDPARVNACGLEVHLSGIAFCHALGESQDQHLLEEDAAAVSGAAFLARRDMLEEIGGLDDRFFMYMEDAELSMRARLAGRDIVMTPRSRVVHDYELNVGARKFYYLERNRIFMLANIFRLRTLALMLPALVLAEAGVWMYAGRCGPSMLAAKARSYVGVAASLRSLLRRRARVQSLRRVGDRALLGRMTPDLPQGLAGQPGMLTRIANCGFRGYFLMLRYLVRW